MSNGTPDSFESDETTNAGDEREALRKRADLMGIKYHHMNGVATLRELINARLAEQPAEVEVTSQHPQNEAKKASDEKLFMSEAEYAQEQRKEARKNANRLVRLRVTCMNPLKKNWPGEIISVGSAKLGTFKKYIPFRADVPYHVPHIIYEELRERKCRIGYTVDGPNGEKINKYKLIPEFALEVLPPLSDTELRKLAQRQAMARNEDVLEEH